MMRYVASACCFAMLLTPSILFGQSAAREPTDVLIRRSAGLPPGSARGQIELVDVGHNPLDTMISIVGNRTGAGWVVSYACAMSPNCSNDADHLATEYTLSATKSAEVDRLIEQLRSGGEPDGQRFSPNVISGYLHVRINVPGFKREYHRQMMWGKTLGHLATLLQPPSP
jgi:hypothetical protein